MGQRYLLSIVIIPLFLACGRAEETTSSKVHSTSFLFSKKQLANLLTAKEQPLPAGVVFNSPPSNLFPRVGAVSHHLLVANIIDHYFASLKSLRKVTTFIILSPLHYPQGRLGPIAISSEDWQLGTSLVACDKACVSLICQALSLTEDPSTFQYEHGIASLLPFIKKYFPKAQIAPLALVEESHHLSPIDQLASVLAQLLTQNKDYFLLLSIDFSHRAGPELTKARDTATARFLACPSLSKFRHLFSDNNKGLRILALLYPQLSLSESFLVCHTNSRIYLGREAENITSYFFYFWGQRH